MEEGKMRLRWDSYTFYKGKEMVLCQDLAQNKMRSSVS